jgi:hypothetical protein
MIMEVLALFSPFPFIVCNQKQVTRRKIQHRIPLGLVGMGTGIVFAWL